MLIDYVEIFAKLNLIILKIFFEFTKLIRAFYEIYVMMYCIEGYL